MARDPLYASLPNIQVAISGDSCAFSIFHLFMTCHAATRTASTWQSPRNLLRPSSLSSCHTQRIRTSLGRCWKWSVADKRTKFGKCLLLSRKMRTRRSFHRCVSFSDSARSKLPEQKLRTNWSLALALPSSRSLLLHSELVQVLLRVFGAEGMIDREIETSRFVTLEPLLFPAA